MTGLSADSDWWTFSLYSRQPAFQGSGNTEEKGTETCKSWSKGKSAVKQSSRQSCTLYRIAGASYLPKTELRPIPEHPRMDGKINVKLIGANSTNWLQKLWWRTTEIPVTGREDTHCSENSGEWNLCAPCEDSTEQRWKQVWPLLN